MKKTLLVLFVIVSFYGISQSAYNYAGSYDVKGCGLTDYICTATVKAINPNTIIISRFACVPFNVLNCVDTVIADLDFSNHTIDAHFVSFNVYSGVLTYKGSGTFTSNSMEITYFQTNPNPGSQYICHTYDNFSPLGIQNANATNFQVTISPNPSSDRISIELNATDHLEVDIYDVNGKHVLKSLLSSSGDIDVSELAQGVYSARITNGTKQITKKLAILR